MAFIDDHRDRFGVEPICRVLTEHGVTIAPSGYYAFKKRHRRLVPCGTPLTYSEIAMTAPSWAP